MERTSTAAAFGGQRMTTRERELELARSAGRGDRVAGRELVRLLIDRVAITVRCLAAGDPNAEDYIQDAMIEILRSASSFRAASSLHTWAERIAVRVSMRRIRQHSFRRDIVALAPQPDATSPTPTAEEALNRQRIWERIGAALETLGPEQRAAVVLRLVLGCSVAEIAELTDARLNTVRDRLALGRRQLRERVLADPQLVDYVHRTGAER